MKIYIQSWDTTRWKEKKEKKISQLAIKSESIAWNKGGEIAITSDSEVAVYNHYKKAEGSMGKLKIRLSKKPIYTRS